MHKMGTFELTFCIEAWRLKSWSPGVKTVSVETQFRDAQVGNYSKRKNKNNSFQSGVDFNRHLSVERQERRCDGIFWGWGSHACPTIICESWGHTFLGLVEKVFNKANTYFSKLAPMTFIDDPATEKNAKAISQQGLGSYLVHGSSTFTTYPLMNTLGSARIFWN